LIFLFCDSDCDHAACQLAASRLKKARPTGLDRTAVCHLHHSGSDDLGRDGHRHFDTAQARLQAATIGNYTPVGAAMFVAGQLLLIFVPSIVLFVPALIFGKD